VYKRQKQASPEDPLPLADYLVQITTRGVRQDDLFEDFTRNFGKVIKNKLDQALPYGGDQKIIEEEVIKIVHPATRTDLLLDILNMQEKENIDLAQEVARRDEFLKHQDPMLLAEKAVHRVAKQLKEQRVILTAQKEASTMATFPTRQSEDLIGDDAGMATPMKEKNNKRPWKKWRLGKKVLGKAKKAQNTSPTPTPQNNRQAPRDRWQDVEAYRSSVNRGKSWESGGVKV
jgi:hypothetical protein